MSNDPIIQAALALMQMIADKAPDVNGNEVYLAQDLERFVRNQERNVGESLNALFVDPKEIN